MVIGIPVHNEQLYIGSTLLLARQVADTVVIVDDGSTDITKEVLTNPPSGVKIITNPINLGYGEALKKIFMYFILGYNDGDVLVILDGDGQHNPLEANRLVEKLIKDKADMVIGSRFLNQNIPNVQDVDVPVRRKFGINAVNILMKYSQGTVLTDTQSGFRVYSYRASKEIAIHLNNTGMGASLEILQILQEAKMTIKEESITCLYTEDSSGQNMFTHGADLVGTIVQRMAEKHTKWIITFAIMIIFIGIGFGIRAIQLYNTLHILIPNYIFLSTSFTILGIAILQIGITLYSMARIRENS